MNQKTAAMVAMYALTAMTSWTGSLAQESAIGHEARRKSVAPRTLVAKWMELVLEGNVEESWALTTRSKGLNAHHDLPRVANKEQLRVDRALGNKTAAVVVTNRFRHPDADVDRAFVFWLVKRDDTWLINISYVDDPQVIDEQVRGFLMGASPVWHVTKEDLVGMWETGPGAPGGTGPIACGSQFHLKADGNFELAWWGPGGPLDGTEVQHGTWQMDGDRIVRVLDQQRLVSRIAWFDRDLLVLQADEITWRNSLSGTHYHRVPHVGKND